MLPRSETTGRPTPSSPSLPEPQRRHGSVTTSESPWTRPWYEQGDMDHSGTIDLDDVGISPRRRDPGEHASIRRWRIPTRFDRSTTVRRRQTSTADRDVPTARSISTTSHITAKGGYVDGRLHGGLRKAVIATPCPSRPPRCWRCIRLLDADVRRKCRHPASSHRLLGLSSIETAAGGRRPSKVQFQPSIGRCVSPLQAIGLAGDYSPPCCRRNTSCSTFAAVRRLHFGRPLRSLDKADVRRPRLRDGPIDGSSFNDSVFADELDHVDRPGVLGCRMGSDATVPEPIVAGADGWWNYRLPDSSTAATPFNGQVLLGKALRTD